MTNPNNLTMHRGRLGHDASFRKNSDGSTVVLLSVIVGRNYKTGGEYLADSVNYQKYIPAGNDSQLDYYKKWAKKGFEVSVTGSVQSSKFERDGKTEYSTALVIDTIDLSTNNGAKLKALDADGNTDVVEADAKVDLF